ncbi:conserved domain protein [Paenibacillus sp. HGF5]|nr:conserved domain protein [Paenibacillus sp. HGF5]
MYIIVIALALIGGISTLLVGLSQENKKENPNYERKTRTNLTKLLIIYLVSLIAFIVIWMIFR